MEQTHDPIRHLKFFRQALSQDKKIGFLISAGCPLGVDMPAGKWPLIPDIENLTKLTSETIIKSANKVKYELLHYIYCKHRELYMTHFDLFIDYLVSHIEREEKEKIKIMQCIEIKIGRIILNPFRWIKSVFK